jgi:Tol biopolymer transport system component
MTPIQPQVTDERLDRLVRQVLTERADDAAAGAMPAETMAAVVASNVRRGGTAERRTLLLAAAALLIVLAAGAVAVGSALIRQGPEPQPAPQPVVAPSLDATAPTPSNATAEPEHVFYTVLEETRIGEEGCTESNASRFGRCTSSRIWVADPDGSNARELFPESTDHRSIVDVSSSGDAMVFTAPTQINGQPISASHLADLGPAGDVLATRVLSHEVVDDGCEGMCAFDSEFTFSPDGTRLAYVRASVPAEEPDYATVIAIQDVATGEVMELDATRAGGPDGYNEAPRWSPDGMRLLFSRNSIGVAPPEARLLDTASFVVDADGGNLRQLVDTALFAKDAAWSPDGSTIAFTSAIAWLGVDQFGKRENFNEDADVYTVRADGSDRRRLTNFAPTRVDRGAPVQVGGRVAGWTREGRIVFTVHRWAGEGDSTNLPTEVWIMDADGANARQIDGTDVASLTAAGCVDCPYPPDTSGLDYSAFWRPAP